MISSEDVEDGPIPLLDLSLFWRGRAQALRLMNAQRSEPDAVTAAIVATFEECASELRDALAAVPADQVIANPENLLGSKPESSESR